MRKTKHKGISTLVAVILLVLAIASGIIFYTIPRLIGYRLSDYPTTLISSEEFNISVTAIDQFGKTITSYTGSIYFTSTDTNAIIPEPGTLSDPYTFVSSDNGVHIFNGFQLISIDTNESYTITVSDGKKTETSNSIKVNSYPTLDQFEFNPISSPQAISMEFDIEITAVDQYGHILTGYAGAPTLTYSEGSISPNTVTSWSNGVGTNTVKVTDGGTGCSITVDDASATGTSNPFDVTSVSSASFIVDATLKVKVDVPFTVTVIAMDQSGNVETGYLGTVHFTSNDESAILPDDYTFVSSDNGIHMFSITLKKPVTSSITVIDVMTPSRIGSVSRYVYMQMPSFVGFGSADLLHGYEGLSPTYPFDLQANDLILMQLVGDASYMPITPAGFTLLYGPDQSENVHQWIYYRFAEGYESGQQILVNYPGECSKAAVLYAFRNIAQTNFVEGASFGYGNSPIISAQSVVTSDTSRLAVSFVFVGAQDDYNELSTGFQGSSGGVWTNPVGDFNLASNIYQSIDLTLQIQVAQMEKAGTISGGIYTMTKPGNWGVRAFCLIP
ncbi:hypothetical protein E4H04_12050 [Candidatus Bathyarchaeota archaeon]|nr:MAG: hypothetical protein E4H04_12050 [Candidatus Bathyarchaeota archaeon]